jgi:hypothetical protein
MQKLKRIPEAEVIAEFLKNEFHHSEFHTDRKRFEDLVLHPDLKSEKQNAIRRMLLFRRHEALWRGLPQNTQWWDVHIETADLALIRVSSRPEWKQIANGSMLLKNIAERIRSGHCSGSSVCTVQAISYCLRQTVDHSSVMLIGVDENMPLTILEGNHRLVAALLANGERAPAHFRVIAGYSAQMNECCCYDPSLSNRWRQLKGRLRSLFGIDANRLPKDAVLGPVERPTKIPSES